MRGRTPGDSLARARWLTTWAITDSIRGPKFPQRSELAAGGSSTSGTLGPTPVSETFRLGTGNCVQRRRHPLWLVRTLDAATGHSVDREPGEATLWTRWAILRGRNDRRPRTAGWGPQPEQSTMSAPRAATRPRPAPANRTSVRPKGADAARPTSPLPTSGCVDRHSVRFLATGRDTGGTDTPRAPVQSPTSLCRVQSVTRPSRYA